MASETAGVAKAAKTAGDGIDPLRDLLNRVRAASASAQKTLDDFNKSQRDVGTSGTAAAGGVRSLFRELAALEIAKEVVGGVVQLGQETLRTASQVMDLSKASDLSYATIQKLGFVAGQSGGSLESMSNAAVMLTKNLSKGGRGVAGALDEVGLSLQQLRRMNADEQFWAVVRALSGVQDEMTRIRAASTLFGRQFSQVMGAIRDDMLSVADAAPVMADATVESLDRMGDRADAAYRRLSVTVGNIIATMYDLAEEQAKVPGSPFSGLLPPGYGKQPNLPRSPLQRNGGPTTGLMSDDELDAVMNEEILQFVSRLSREDARKLIDPTCGVVRPQLHEKAPARSAAIRSD